MKTSLIIRAIALISLFLGGCTTIPKVTTKPYLKVDISDQTLKLFNDHVLVKTYSINSSKYGIGFRKGSKKTPLGNFNVIEKIGYNLPKNTNFKSRRPTRRHTGIIGRIIRLEGLDKNNKNTESRGIYIHGTNHAVGRAASIGCITLTPDEVIDLFDKINVGTKLEIIK